MTEFTAEELDARMRRILQDATVHSVFSSTRELMALGFSPYTAFTLLEAHLIETERARNALTLERTTAYARRIR